MARPCRSPSPVVVGGDLRRVQRRGPGGWILAALVSLTLIASCTTTVDGHPQAPRSSAGEGGAGPAATPAKVPRPVDRNPTAVTVALRQLDACAVFDLNAANATNPNLGVIPVGPHACMLWPTEGKPAAPAGVKVFVGDSQNDLFLNSGAPTVLAGVKAYERYDYSTSASKSCEIDLPVSFSRSIHFQFKSSNPNPCEVLRPVAAAAVPRLQNPDPLTADTAKRPFGGWDGCTFLMQLLGTDVQNSYTYKPDGLDPFSGCKTTLKSGSSAPAKPGTPSKPGAPATGPGRGTPPSSTEPKNEPKVEVTYEMALRPPQQGRQIAGKTADITQFSTNCRLMWSQGASGVGTPDYAAAVIRVTAATCDNAAQLAERAAALFDQHPSDTSTAPQRPLLYRPEDNDNPEPGACGDFNGGAGCEPYHPTPVPQGVENMLAAADNDQNVTCAVFQDAVKDIFGPTYQPVTWGEHCFFVEPTHTVLLRCNVDGQNPPSEYGKSTDVYTGRQEIRIEGKAAVVFWDTEHSQYDVYLSPFNDMNRTGNLHITVQARPGRGDTAWKGGLPKLDDKKAELGKQVIAHVAKKFVTR